MERIKVIFESGNSLYTRINGTVDEIESYYLGQYFNMGHGSDRMEKCVKIVFLDS